MTERERCESCRYWRTPGATCHKYAPRYAHFREGMNWASPIARWPSTMADDWCGEWRERERDPMDVTQR